jgi:hypothetical protein
MFNLHFTNNYIQPLSVNGVNVPPNGGKISTGVSAGNFIVTSPGLNVFSLLDLGDTKIPGYELPQTWGILIRFEQVEIYSRYEGNGEYNIVFDRLGDVSVETLNGNSLLVHLPGLTLVK